MANERRGDRRPGGRPGGGGGGEFRPFRGGGRPHRAPDEPFVERDRGPRPPGRPPFGAGRPPARGAYPPRPVGDEGGMNVRVDPRRLGLLKQLAAEAGLRPGELVQRWIEERLDAERSGQPAPSALLTDLNGAISSIAARVDEIASRVAKLEASRAEAAPPARVAPATVPDAAPAPAAPRRRGRPRKADAASAPATPARPRRRAAARSRGRSAASPKVGLHEEIIAVIRERGPMRAAELAAAIVERGNYRAPRSSRPLDAATVNSRVSNPVYRARFRRESGRIGLAAE